MCPAHGSPETRSFGSTRWWLWHLATPVTSCRPAALDVLRGITGPRPEKRKTQKNKNLSPLRPDSTARGCCATNTRPDFIASSHAKLVSPSRRRANHWGLKLPIPLHKKHRVFDRPWHDYLERSIKCKLIVFMAFHSTIGWLRSACPEKVGEPPGKTARAVCQIEQPVAVGSAVEPLTCQA